jgi:hypothetical protein
MNPITPCRFVAAPALAAALTATPAFSQQAGHYSGLTSQGQPIALDIITSADGAPVLLDVVAFYETLCAASGRTITAGYAAIPEVPLNDQGGLKRRGVYVIWAYGWMNAVFDGAATFTGTTGVTNAVLLPSLPVVAENCFARHVSFSATLDSSAKPAVMPAGLLESSVAAEWSAGSRISITRGEPVIASPAR